MHLPGFVLITAFVMGRCQHQQSDSSPYCRISARHTLCQFQGVGEKCNSVSARGLDERSRQVIVQTHNSLRSILASGQESRGLPGPQPHASNMQLMIWDDELATAAQRHADQCHFEHDCNECRKLSRFPVGQNMGIEWTTGPALSPNWKKMITKWYEEVEEFPPSSATRYEFSVVTGHYSQIVWADTNRVGCGYISYLDGLAKTNLYVCNYGPAGNFVSLPAYKVGPPCSQCPLNTICSSLFNNLCEPIGKKPSNSSSSSSSSVPTVNSISGIADKAVSKPNQKPISRPATHQVPTAHAAPVPAATAPGNAATEEQGLTCKIGRGLCPAGFTGAVWAFKTDESSVFQSFLETTVPVGESTELHINRSYSIATAPGVQQELCISLQMRQDGVADGWTAPPLLIKIQPETSQAMVVPIQNDHQNQGKWAHLKMTVSRIRTPFKVLFQQSGPLPIDGRAPPTVAAATAPLRLALGEMQLNSGVCRP